MVNYGNLPKFEFLVVTISAFLIAIFLMQTQGVKRNNQYSPIENLPLPTVQLNYQTGKEPQISARSALVIDKTTQAIIFSKNPNLRFTPASATKIMTAYVALQQYQLDDVITIDNEKIPGSTIRLVPGEKITVQNLLYGMLLNSGNDAAYALAKYHSKGVRGFVNDMNKAARELELTNTHFTDPAGLEDEGNFTTTYDLSKLAIKAMENATFRKIVSTKEKTVSGHELRNLNELLWQVPGVNGVKTGFTDIAGGVLVTSFEQGKTQLVIVVFKSEDRFADSKELIGWVLQAKQGQ
ncbi:D-alanyl-D-alanine carboxypeptidase [Candidatus Microgenomates bacterium]|nr:D-alanyl-D-alanine carboxypeptidase [Candidatus Microgenomates bacterium]